MPAGNPEPEKTKLRILYAIGPGDVVQLYRDLGEGKKPEFQIGKAFSQPFLDWCDAAGATAHFISWHPRRDSLQVGRHVVENHPRSSLFYKGGLKHHIGLALYGLWLVWKAIRERADVVIIDSGTTHWIILSLLSMLGIPVLGVMHNTLWPMTFPPSRRSDRILSAMDGIFFRHFGAGTVALSPECARQIYSVSGGKPHGPVHTGRAQYQPGLFDDVAPVPPFTQRPFRILFFGRVLEYKGVFMILDMAERLEKEMPDQFAWKICGSGADLERLRLQVKERNLGKLVEVTGRVVPKQDVLDAFSWAHAMIVPTTSGFCEALAMTAAESILNGRPVVLSTVVPAWEILGDAAIKAEAEDVDSFVEAIRKLATSQEYYERCRKATETVQGQFYDMSLELGTVLGNAILELKK